MAEKNRNRSEVAVILTEACAQNLPLDLRVLDAKTSESYKSRFLGLALDARPPVLTVEAPTSKGGVVPVRAGNTVQINFSYEDGSRSFRTQVLGRGRFELNPKVTVPSLELAPPQTLSPGEKRNFYRVILSDIPIELGVSVFAEKEGRARRIRAREKAILTDIGGGGLGFRIPEGKSLLLDPDKRLFLTFRLPREDEPLRLLGRICFSIRRRELREAFFGVQFTDVDSELEYKRDIDRILRFVAEIQRQALSARIPTAQK
jgi:c-di-GMP-binding flagellar brake protein YcgR